MGDRTHDIFIKIAKRIRNYVRKTSINKFPQILNLEIPSELDKVAKHTLISFGHIVLGIRNTSLPVNESFVSNLLKLSTLNLYKAIFWDIQQLLTAHFPLQFVTC